MGSFHKNSAENTRSSCMQKGFRLQECPGVDFSLRFYPSGGNVQTSAANSLSCRLLLEVSGAVAEGLHLAVALSISFDLSVESKRTMEQQDEQDTCRTVASVTDEIVGTGELQCDGIWPLDVAASSIICRAELTFR